MTSRQSLVQSKPIDTSQVISGRKIKKHDEKKYKLSFNLSLDIDDGLEHSRKRSFGEKLQN